MTAVPHRLLLAVFALSLMLSAGLLFNVQPMIGKMLLPRVGGSPYAWNIVMAFFQLALLAGYLLAHLLRRLPVWQHGLAYLCAAAISVAFLPLSLPENWYPDTSGAVSLAIIHMLVTVVAVPFVTLSLSAPTLQRLFAASQHDRARDPYFLYVASNFGSFAGLLLYPFVFEPLWSTGTQASLWYYGFIALIALIAICLLLQSRSAAPESAAVYETTTPAPDWKLRGKWLLLAFIPSSLTLGVTTFITSDVTSAPMLWVLTLALYLLTFMLAFTQRGERIRRYAIIAHMWFAVAAVANTVLPVVLPVPVVILHLFAFFTVALTCHTRLAELRPDPKYLTEFYLWLSIGGALGGSFNAFVAPVVFNTMLEYPLVLTLAVALHIRTHESLNEAQKLMGVTVWIFILGCLNLINYYLAGQAIDALRNILLIPLLATIAMPVRPYRMLVYGCAALMLAGLILMPYQFHRSFAARSFFGVIITNDYQTAGGAFKYRQLQHGTTSHGAQFIEPASRSTELTTYYADTTPLGNLWNVLQPGSVAVMGLGTGTLACRARSGERVHFFEIDPLMVKVANEQFSFLRQCGNPKVTLGDGRLELERDTDTYDLIIIDVFSSDAIPVHIITKEAIQIYLSKLNPGGVLGFHVSNRFFDLEPVLAAAANDLGLTAIYGATMESETSSDRIVFPTQVVAISATPASLMPLVHNDMWDAAENPKGIRAWTDDYSNLFSAMK